MKKFLMKTVAFSVIMLITLGVSALYIPNLAIMNSLYYSSLDKHEALQSTKSPRIIFVGGSNISFGLNSRRIAEKLKIEVVNMGLHAGLGLKYMANEIKPYLRPGDIVIIVPEYDHFYDKWLLNGRDDLLFIIFDVFPAGRKHISLKQWAYLCKSIPHYSADKLSRYVRFVLKNSSISSRKEVGKPIGVYDRKSFNTYGDAVAHWGLDNVKFTPYPGKAAADIEPTGLIRFLNGYNESIRNKKAELYLMYPCFQETSFNNARSVIQRIQKELTKLEFPVLSTPERSHLPDKYFFDSPYHLNKEGVDIRTQNVLEDLGSVFPGRLP